MSQEAAAEVKQHGRDNDLVERIKNDAYFKPIHSQLENLLDPSTFIGRAPDQVVDFLTEEVKGVVDQYENKLDSPVELNN